MKSVFKRNKDQFGPFCTNLLFIFELVDLRAFSPRPAPPRPAPPRGFLPLPRPAKKQVLPRPAPPRENWQNLRGRAGQSLFESLEN